MIATMGAAMTDPRDTLPDAGIRADRARQRRIYLIMGTLAGAGFVVGFFSSMFEREGGGFLEGIGPVWAVAASIILVVSVIVGTIVYFRQVDELERRNNYWANATGCNAVLIGYPVWYLLWRGGLVSEPTHESVFVVLIAATTLAYLWKKFRP